MEANREESLQCLEKAKREYLLFQKNKNAKDHFENSHRLAKKSERMFPSTEAKNFISRKFPSIEAKNLISELNGWSTLNDRKLDLSLPGPRYGTNMPKYRNKYEGRC